MSINPRVNSWTVKDVQRLINCIRTLNLELPPNEDDVEWQNIDKFLKKPAGSSVEKIKQLIRRRSQEKHDNIPELDSSSELNCSLNEQSFELGLSDNESFFKKSSVSQTGEASTLTLDDPDVMFLMQLIPDIKQLKPENKSSLKCEIQQMVHQLNFPQ